VMGTFLFLEEVLRGLFRDSDVGIISSAVFESVLY
jgi:hypothetical protein